ncbi:putative ABC transport system permease protein [Marinilactibacillus piezotolerans]|uniref:Putative ABC transport system permease protein n=1 Tax=Marinilactibacillus piezotolerans TaxID=258723 RepID=A0A1I3VXY3_9LACT|nr:ABC transporter ATP-binding protein/permease [Marinilactibacillus piezotolerans]SFJ99989.1 putative ABC transport system permease protein [Marinilactibacillus piezotolerans]
MLEVQNIKKYYKVGETTTKALDGVSVAFRKQEFVAILGPSGSGKTTMLNVIGGLDQYDSGDMIINGKSTKTFKDRDWDAYRNNSIGFVFQNYNLIGHLGIIDNVELGMTLSGVSKDEKREKAERALTRVGLKDHMNKKPTQLSGGQMQRVAIARALANDPDILLCDEPTGALDTETSIQIMDLIKELSNEKLVVMVTHNPELAHNYTDRIIEFEDGKILSDSNPYTEQVQTDQFNLKQTKMTFFTALKLSFNNIRTKKGRTILTSFASSIGIIGIAIVLALSNGFQIQIDQTQSETLAQFPITISSVTTDRSSIEDNEEEEVEEYPDTETVTVEQSDQEQIQHINNIDEEYVDYIENIDPELSNNVGFTRSIGMNLLREVDGEVEPVSFSNAGSNDSSSAITSALSTSTGIGVSTFPTQLDDSNGNFLEDNYSLLEGSYPESPTDVVLIVDETNTTNIHALENLGFELESGDELNFEDIVGTTINLVANDDYYTELPTGGFVPNTDYQSLYDNENNQTITISGILRVKASSTMDLLAPGIAYSNDLTTDIIEQNQNSAIVQAQEDSEINVMTGEPVDETTKGSLMTYLGGESMPSSIMIYPNNFEDKEEVLNYLDEYNEDLAEEDQIVYQDLAGTMTELTGGLMDAITYVLIAFAAISLITSMIMISIITYTSVIERTKEIGVLKALGARKKDVTRVFDAETCILGVTSGTLGVLIAWLVTFPANYILYQVTDLENVAQLNPLHAILLIIISTVLTMLGGHIPARMAAKKDAAIALRSE